MAILRRQAGRTTVRVWALIGSIALVSAAGWLTVGLRLPALWSPISLSVLVVLVAFALAELLLVNFEFRGHAQSLTLGEVPLLIGLVFCSPGALLAARLGGSLLVLAGHFRQSGQKLAFNLSMHSLKVLVALFAYRAALGDASPVSVRGWAAALLAAAAADVVSHTLILGVITLTAGKPPRGAILPMALTASIAASTNSGLALLAVVVIWHQPAAAVLLAFVAGVYAVGYRAHTTMRRRYANLERLYQFTDVLSTAYSEDEVIDAVLRESCDLLRATQSTLVVPIGSVFQRYRRAAEGHVECDLLGALGVLEKAAVDRGAIVLVPRRPRDHDARQVLEDDGFRDAMAVPFAVGDAIGVLVVADRASEVSTFDADDSRLFETLANHTAVALQGGQLLARLREEVAAKEHQALHDHLTGLANRTLFAARVEEALAGPEVGSTTVMLMDLDRFKEINDTLGHHTGDTVLRHIATRLVATVGDRGTVARLGGDEFAIVCRQSTSGESAALAFAQELRSAAEAPVAVDEMTLEVQASIGIAIAPDHGNDSSTLLQRADVAMYDAKGDNSGIAVYAPDNDHYTPRRLSLVSELRAALADDALELYYQPQVRMSDRAVLGVEALLRWNHATYGFISPDEFIPVAEHCGLIAPLTSWVIDTALTQASAWQALGLDLTMAVNMSARSIADERLLDEIEALLCKTGVDPQRLVLELTETSVMTDMSGGIDLLHRLAATGAHISIDDFGTGYSSLSRLAKLPVDEVKIDRSFVMGMEHDASNAVIVRSTIDLARNLGLSVVAEGVETTTAWDALAALGCDAAQGYLISRPVPASELVHRMSAWKSAAPRAHGRVAVPV